MKQLLAMAIGIHCFHLRRASCAVQRNENLVVMAVVFSRFFVLVLFKIFLQFPLDLIHIFEILSLCLAHKFLRHQGFFHIFFLSLHNSLILLVNEYLIGLNTFRNIYGIITSILISYDCLKFQLIKMFALWIVAKQCANNLHMMLTQHPFVDIIFLAKLLISLSRFQF